MVRLSSNEKSTAQLLNSSVLGIILGTNTSKPRLRRRGTSYCMSVLWQRSQRILLFLRSIGGAQKPVCISSPTTPKRYLPVGLIKSLVSPGAALFRSDKVVAYKFCPGNQCRF